MKSKKFLVLLFIGLVAGCTAPRNLMLYRDIAESAEIEGDYGKAVQAWNSYFSQFPAMDEIDGAVYARAARTAYKAGESGQAVAWYDQARYRNFSSAEMYSTLADIFRKQDNLSRELSALEFLQKNFNGEVEGINSRMFAIYNEIDMTEEAMSAWKEMRQVSKNNEQNLRNYFILNKKLGNEIVCDSLSQIMLERNPEDVAALEWEAKKLYNQAEERYLNQMESYENNRTRRQYRILLGELEEITANFKKALGHFEKLWELNPPARAEYAGYISNIYVRFKDEKNATYYRSLAE